MAEHPQEQEQEEPRSVAKLTTEIVVAYVTRNTIAPADLGDLIGAVARAFGTLGREQAEPAKPEPAVPVRRSVQDDHLVCLVCGQKQKTLKRDLAVRHELSPAAPRGGHDLNSDYPLVARSYAAQRSELARRTGLGRKPAPAAPAATARMRGATRQKRPRPVIACHSVSQVLRHASPFTESTWSTRAGAPPERPWRDRWP
jgi:predicted transcriptional regulator